MQNITPAISCFFKPQSLSIFLVTLFVCVFTLTPKLAISEEVIETEWFGIEEDTKGSMPPMPTIHIIKQNEENVPDRAKPEVIMKKAPSYEFNRMDSTRRHQRNYQRAIMLPIDPKTNPEEIQKQAELRCRFYGEPLRKDYFVNVLNNESYDNITTILCKDVEGPVIRNQPEPDKHPVTRALSKPLEQDKDRNPAKQ